MTTTRKRIDAILGPGAAAQLAANFDRRDLADKRSTRGQAASDRRGNDRAAFAVFADEFVRQTGGTYSEARAAFDAKAAS